MQFPIRNLFFSLSCFFFFFKSSLVQKCLSFSNNIASIFILSWTQYTGRKTSSTDEHISIPFFGFYKRIVSVILQMLLLWKCKTYVATYLISCRISKQFGIWSLWWEDILKTPNPPSPFQKHGKYIFIIIPLLQIVVKLLFQNWEWHKHIKRDCFCALICLKDQLCPVIY